MKTILVAAALAAVWSGAPASAQTPHVAATRTVAVHDLDLSRSADVAKLDRRLAAAAHRVCVDRSSAVYGSYAAATSCERATRLVTTAQRDAAVEAAHGTALAAR